MKPLLLALETATDVCSVALFADEILCFEVILQRGRVHAEQLVPLIANALERCERQATELDAVVVSMGPGSYTGLRVGVSTAKGLAEATGAALIGVPTLEALAASVTPYAAPRDIVIPLLNSRRTEVYTAAYQIKADGTLHPLTEPVALEATAVPDWMPHPDRPAHTWLVGEGVRRVAAHLPTSATTFRMLNPAQHNLRAFWVGWLGLERYRSQRFEDVAAFEPFYLKDFVAKPHQDTSIASLSS
ncbi:MAG: tRNA (adenosine(37)-N6)-threonylcarbamoyltransferase complex dimerization subunit type 1 TsaB [Rhodothermus sp.]|nr:tRNA (adenosine(37)-N6)-threonylcarbamoyltransferase complex dimerization subunit type 1 TsaB [Rhodothermus sp.]